MYQGLFFEDQAGIPRPLLAASVTVAPDAKTYTFKLREGSSSTPARR